MKRPSRSNRSEPKPTSGLGVRAARGAAVTLSGQAGKVLIQLASVVVLARILSPTDYGLIAMVVVIIGAGEIFRDFGLSSAAVQAPSLSVKQRDNLFWVNTLLGTILCVLVFAAAGLIAELYGHRQLVPIVHALSLIFLLNGIATQYRADLVRRLRFRFLATAEVVAPAVAFVLALCAALLGWGFWALVMQQLAQALALLIMMIVAARWIPGRPHRHESIRGFLRFGWNMLATQLVGYVSNNIDTALIGLRFGPASLGIYSRAFQLLMTPLNQVRVPLTTVALPVLARLQNETQRFNEWICRGQLALGYTVVPLLGIVAGTAEPLTQLLLGPQWMEVAPILRLLALAGIFQILAFVGYWVYVSRGLTGDLLRYSLVSALIKVVCIVGGSYWGVIGIAAGYALAPALSWPISIWWLSRRTSLPTRRLYAGALRILVLVAAATCAAGLASWGLATADAIPRLAAAVAAATTVYGLAGLAIPPIRRDLTGVMSIVRLVPRARGTSSLPKNR
ncbi:lipopolysaccharide biosynthesis protein [Cryobacterium roopkundense]|uniref:PST family polysaccharide transporter n=1 Tax=Cryobacterium roopkundense TaxID=1001240 RepID=A0A7W9E690_9MICO|nr:lipopolysaccharide biosynthesis protein [Cryobacterium roopkundense]MBB5642805.1 PST family polysaccharide transporter [Cryobacterium roopkundense]